MTVGSLFSGIGGFDLGLQRAGMTVRWQVERDPWCQRVLAKHWPTVSRYGDIRQLTGSELAPVTLVCAGWPCPPVSQAGERRGIHDDRWLWPEVRRIVGRVGSPLVLLEQPPGILTVNHGGAFGQILTDLADLGYDSTWTVLSARAMGAPHLRKRVWLVSHTHGWGRSKFGPPEQRDQSSQPRAQLDRRGADRRLFDAPVGGDWAPEPPVCRMVARIPQLPHRVDRLRGLGNAVVPQCAEWIGRRILAVYGESPC